MNNEQMKRKVEWKRGNQLLHNQIEKLIVCSEYVQMEWTRLDLSSFVCLRKLKVCNGCFKYVEEVKLIGLKKLERVVIGKLCFTRRNEYREDPYRRFYLKDCERLKELKIGRGSFSDYSVCEIENVPSLEVIEMGELDGGSDSFYYASLELKSDCERMK